MNLEPINKDSTIPPLEIPGVRQKKIPKVSPTSFTPSFPILLPHKELSFLEKEFSVSHKSKKEITDSMEKQEKEIEAVLAKLKGQKARTSLVEGRLAVKGATLDLVDKVREKSLSGMKYLESIFPDYVVGNPEIASRIHESYSVLEMSQVIQNALDSGLTGLAQIYKGRLLRESEKILKDVKNSYVKNHKKLPTSIKEWEKKISKERERLNETYIKMGLTSTRRGMALLKLPFVMKSLPFNPARLSQGMKITGPIIGFILSAIHFKSSEESAAQYEKWITKYKIWKEKTEKGGKIEPLNTFQRPPKLISAQQIAQGIHLPRQHYRKEFDRLIDRTGIEEIKSVLKQCDVELDPSVKNKKDLIYLFSHQRGFKKQILSSYIYYRENMIKMMAVAKYSDNLIVKREAIVEKKIIQLKPRFEELKGTLLALNKSHFEKDLQDIAEKGLNVKFPLMTNLLEKMGLKLPAGIKSTDEALRYINRIKQDPLEMNVVFKNWFSMQSKESLLKVYVDHQETLELTTKNALREMVTKKNELNKKFIKTDLFESRILFALSTATFVITNVLAILALTASLTIPGGPLLLVLLSTASTWIGKGFMALGLYMKYRYKRSSYNIKTYFENIALKFDQLFVHIHTYRNLAKQKKLKETEEIVSQLQKVYKKDTKEYENALVKELEKYKSAKADYEENQNKLNIWKEKAKKLEERLAHKAWKDYARFADLKNDEKEKTFDTLRSLERAVEKMDVTLLEPETRNFFENQLGMDIEQVQKEMKKNPIALREALKHVFVMDENRIGSFIENQNEKMKASR